MPAGSAGQEEGPGRDDENWAKGGKQWASRSAPPMSEREAGFGCLWGHPSVSITNRNNLQTPENVQHFHNPHMSQCFTPTAGEVPFLKRLNVLKLIYTNNPLELKRQKHTNSHVSLTDSNKNQFN